MLPIRSGGAEGGAGGGAAAGGADAGARVSMTAGRRCGTMEEAPTMTLPSKAAPAGLPERDDPVDASQMHRPCGIAPAERRERERKESGRSGTGPLRETGAACPRTR